MKEKTNLQNLPYKILTPPRFLKDVARCKKRGYDLQKLQNVIQTLAEGQPLPPRCRPHRLTGEYHDCWECHIAPDWLLVWKQEEEKLTLIMTRTGTHSDLF